MQLLVSVADASEARAAVAGGADVIDAKDPRQGALGTVRPDALDAIRAAVGAGRPLSVALGDAGPASRVERLAGAAARLGAAFVKVGFRDGAAAAAARRRAAAARRGAGAVTGVVLVAYADWRRAGSLGPPGAVLALAVETGAAGVLLDTLAKQTGLLALLGPGAVGEWVARAHASGLFACLAGGLRGEDFATACGLGADLVGVRGAACVGGRTGRVSRARVAALSALAGAAPPSLAAPATLV